MKISTCSEMLSIVVLKPKCLKTGAINSSLVIKSSRVMLLLGIIVNLPFEARLVKVSLLDQASAKGDDRLDSDIAKGLSN